MEFLEYFHAENRASAKWGAVTFWQIGERKMADNRQFPSLTIPCNIDKRTFFRFAVYDSLGRKKGWRSPVLFALIMSAFAAVCFAGRETHAQATLIGGVLLGVGLLLPLIWFGMFFASVNRQAKQSGLSPSKSQYEVTLAPDKIHVTKGKEAADFAWDAVHLVYRDKGCIYLYVSPTRAFLLPDGEKTEKAWEILTARVAPEKIKT